VKTRAFKSLDRILDTPSEKHNKLE